MPGRDGSGGEGMKRKYGSGGGEACDAWLLKNILFRPQYIISLEAETSSISQSHSKF